MSENVDNIGVSTPHYYATKSTNIGLQFRISKKYVPISLIVTVCIIDITFLIAWYLLAFHAKIMAITSLDFIGDFPAMIGVLVAFSVAVFGINVTRQGIFNKGGTPYYREEISRRTIKKIIDNDEIFKKYDDQSKFNVVCQKIVEIKSDNDNHQNEKTQNTLYWKYIYFLQDSSLNFNKIWNNYEYSSTNHNRDEEQIEYTFRLQKYIYCHVYDTYQEEQKRLKKTSAIN